VKMSRLRTTAFALACAAASLAPVATLAAQVGTLPDQSPYKDLDDHQRVGLVAGLINFGRDGADVGPSGTAAAFGARYDLSIGGPGYLTVRALSASVTRNVLDYQLKPAQRLIGTKSSVLTNVDAGLALALTGERSWHNLQPLVNFDVGMIFSSGDNKSDVSGFALKPALSLSMGAGVRWITGSNSELRADVSVYYWQLHYPENYRSTAADPSAIVPTGTLTPWTTNRVFTLGWTWGIFR